MKILRTDCEHRRKKGAMEVEGDQIVCKNWWPIVIKSGDLEGEGFKMSGKTDDVIYGRTFCTLTRILGGKQCVITCL